MSHEVRFLILTKRGTRALEAPPSPPSHTHHHRVCVVSFTRQLYHNLRMLYRVWDSSSHQGRSEVARAVQEANGDRILLNGSLIFQTEHFRKSCSQRLVVPRLVCLREWERGRDGLEGENTDSDNIYQHVLFINSYMFYVVFMLLLKCSYST